MARRTSAATRTAAARYAWWAEREEVWDFGGAGWCCHIDERNLGDSAASYKTKGTKGMKASVNMQRNALARYMLR